MQSRIEYRTATSADFPFLEQMLFEAAYWRTDQSRPALREGLADPELAKILADWGREGDLAVIAHESDQNLGAAWLRFWTNANHSYGFVDETIPELGIGVVREHRGQGISLSVEQDNYSRDLYASEGFETISHIGNSDTMLYTHQTPNG